MISHYSGYLAFFTDSITKDGITKTVERYVFAPENNERGVSMFTRFQAGLLHPLIHIGYGMEFNVPGMVAEGAPIIHIRILILIRLRCRSFDGGLLWS